MDRRATIMGTNMMELTFLIILVVIGTKSRLNLTELFITSFLSFGILTIVRGMLRGLADARRWSDTTCRILGWIIHTVGAIIIVRFIWWLYLTIWLSEDDKYRWLLQHSGLM